MQDVRFASAAGLLPGSILRQLERVPAEIQRQATEIRLRTGRPIILTAGGNSWFLEADGAARPQITQGMPLLEREQVEQAFFALCGYAVHSHQKELADGYIAVRGGHRAGIAGTAVCKEGQVCGVRDISSICLRIAREIPGVADALVSGCFMHGACGLLLAGPPASGKTTLLRDLARQLARGAAEGLRVCVVDESGELGAGGRDAGGCDLGIGSDLLSGYPKARGLETAVRYLSPQVIICDEICTAREVEAVAAACNSGVAVVTSIHASGWDELARKRTYRTLLHTGAFEWVALLRGAKSPSEIATLRRVTA